MSGRTHAPSAYPLNWRSEDPSSRVNSITLNESRGEILDALRDGFDLDGAGDRLTKQELAVLYDAAVEEPPLPFGPEWSREDRVEFVRGRWGRAELTRRLLTAAGCPDDTAHDRLRHTQLGYVFDSVFGRLRERW